MDIDEAISIDFISFPAASPHERFQVINKFPDFQVEAPEEIKPVNDQTCILCEFIMAKLEKDLNNKTTQDEIRHVVEQACVKMPKTIAKTCTQFVDNYAEMLITLLATTPPAKICAEMKCCVPPKEENIGDLMVESKNDVVECAICQSAVIFVDKLLEDPDFDRNIEQVVEKTCKVAPKLYINKVRIGLIYI